MYINRRGKDALDFMINEDKASNYSLQKKQKKQNIIKIDSAELIKMIIDSF